MYGQLKFESGIHRVQRVPVTETSGRMHTSAVSVAVLPQAEEVMCIHLDEPNANVNVTVLQLVEMLGILCCITVWLLLRFSLPFRCSIGLMLMPMTKW